LTDNFELIKQFCQNSGYQVQAITSLKGDGSDRQIYRIKADDSTKIAIYGDNPAENRAFLGFCQTFKECGIRVPEVFAVSSDSRCYLLEDLGDSTIKQATDDLFLQKKYSDIEDLYLRAITILPQIQISVNHKVDYSLCYQLAEFNLENMLFDANRFVEYFIRQLCGIADTSAIEERLKTFCQSLSSTENYFLYRDFQTRNIMLKNDQLCFIDFQSGRKGPLQYDLASFVYSSGTYLWDDLEDRLVSRYLEVLKSYQQVNEAEFKYNFYGFAMIRVIQALGGYAFLGLVKQKKDFLHKIPIGLDKLDLLQKKAGVNLFNTQELKNISAKFKTEK